MRTIEELCRLLSFAAEIIRKQAELLEMHGIETETQELETDRIRLADSIHSYAGECGSGDVNVLDKYEDW